MASYEDKVLTALAETLSEIDELNESPYVQTNPVLPSAEVIPGEVQYDETFGRGHDTCKATIRVTVGEITDEGAQRLLREFRDPAGARSIKEAVEADDTLGELVQGLHVTAASPARQFRRPDGSTSLGCDFDVEYWGYGKAQG